MSRQEPDFLMLLPLFVQLKEEQAEIMKYRNVWKRGSFRKRACLTETLRIMEKWQKGKHWKGIVKQPITVTFFLVSPAFTESHQMNLNLLMCVKFPSLRQNMINTTEIIRHFSNFFLLSPCIYLLTCLKKKYEKNYKKKDTTHVQANYKLNYPKLPK